MKIIKNRQSKYFSHIKRFNTVIKPMLKGKVDRDRARGLQQYTGVDVVEIQ